MSERNIRLNVRKTIENAKDTKILHEIYTLNEKLFSEEFSKFAQVQFSDPLRPIKIAAEFPANTIIRNGYVMNVCIHFAWVYGDREELARILEKEKIGNELLNKLSARTSYSMHGKRERAGSIKFLGEKLVLAIARSEQEAVEIAQFESDALIRRYKSIIADLNNIALDLDFLNSLQVAVTPNNS